MTDLATFEAARLYYDVACSPSEMFPRVNSGLGVLREVVKAYGKLLRVSPATVKDGSLTGVCCAEGSRITTHISIYYRVTRSHKGS